MLWECFPGTQMARRYQMFMVSMWNVSIIGDVFFPPLTRVRLHLDVEDLCMAL